MVLLSPPLSPFSRSTSDEPLTFVSANGNAISVSDPDAAEINDELEVTLSALYGTLTLSTISNLTFTEGSGPTGSMMKFTCARLT